MLSRESGECNENHDVFGSGRRSHPRPSTAKQYKKYNKRHMLIRDIAGIISESKRFARIAWAGVRV